MTRITTPTAHSEQAIDLLERQGPHRLTGDDLIILCFAVPDSDRPGVGLRGRSTLLHRAVSCSDLPSPACCELVVASTGGRRDRGLRTPAPLSRSAVWTLPRSSSSLAARIGSAVL